MAAKKAERILIVAHADGKWYVRRVTFNSYSSARDEMTYVCDKPLGGPFTWEEIVARAWEKPSRGVRKKRGS
jgi:hypothetical protein